ncbi:MAG: 50S ribosome-binding GTPase [Aphanocapsa sp. GSE-SYN-MK-11-07L]|nr:50S ribosome-binding GTPase [Aphanocapsa sp. GSE-SYN-MK-11-07L]
MVRLRPWQWMVLALPIAGLVSLFIWLAGTQLHHWGLDWLWAIILLVLLGWRFLLVRWLQPPELAALEATLSDLAAAPESIQPPTDSAQNQQAIAQVQTVIIAARSDPPAWENWARFWQRCQEMVTAIARIYYPQVKRPILNIYVPQAYGLLRGTVDDVDRWMQKLTPVLGQISIGQVYEAYEVYQKLEPTARWVLRAWNWAQWVLNPAVAVARATTQGYSSQANQQLLSNLGQMMREETLRALGVRAIALYSGATTLPELDLAGLPVAQTETLREILAQTHDPQGLAAKPVNLLLVGRTGAGKSSLINTLFNRDQAVVDVLPSSDRLQAYRWQTSKGEALILWDTPGYEQIGRADLRQQVLENLVTADALILVTPATDPAIQMDVEFLQTARATAPNLPILGVITQVDRLRPLREWQPPYDWQTGDRPKEIAMREAIGYRQSHLGSFCQTLLPLVTANPEQERVAWGVAPLAEALVEVIDPAKQVRLARFLQDLEARIAAAGKIIDHYAFQMGTTQGLAALLKSPILSFLSTMMTGSPTLAILLAEKLPLEQAPVVLGKLQMAYELFSLVADPEQSSGFDLLTLWPLLLETSPAVSQDAWALGQTLIEHWSGAQKLDPAGLQQRYTCYREQSAQKSSAAVS